MLLLSIEGNIGSGKSTIIEYLQELLFSKKNNIKSEYNNFKFLNDKNIDIDKDIVVLKEPLEKWLKTVDDEDHENILDKFYKDQKKWSYPFQMNTFITRSHDIYSNLDKKIIITERSIVSDRKVFAETLKDDKLISSIEWKLYQEWYNWLSSSFNIKPKKSIYFRTSPEISYSRINKRSRNEENTIPLDYIKKIHQKHEEHYTNNNDSYIIDVSCEKNEDYYKNMCQKIFKIIDTEYYS